jgi:hypothetical protein
MAEHQLPELKTPVFDQPAVWKIQSSRPSTGLDLSWGIRRQGICQWVAEASPEEEEEQVKRQRQDDQESSGGVLNGHRVGSGVLSRNNVASGSQVSSPKTTDPLAPKLVN